MQEPLEESESLLFQSLTSRTRNSSATSSDTGQPGRRPKFSTETHCHFSSCPPNCDNFSHVVVLGPVSLYSNDGDSKGEERQAQEHHHQHHASEHGETLVIKNEPYYHQMGASRDKAYYASQVNHVIDYEPQNGRRRNPQQLIFLEKCPPITPTPLNSPKSTGETHQTLISNNDFFSMDHEMLESQQPNFGNNNSRNPYHQGDQYDQFRTPLSPSESVNSCSSSTLSLLSLMTSSPQRRHSFSATVSKATSTSLSSLSLANNPMGGNCPSTTSTTTGTSSDYRQRSYTYSNSTSKVHPYSFPKRMSSCYPSTSTSTSFTSQSQV